MTELNDTTPPTVTRRILVTGDVVRDHYLYEGRDRRRGSTIRLGTKFRESAGGAELLCELLKSVESVSHSAGIRQIEASFGLQGTKKSQAIPQSFCLMRPYPKSSERKDLKNTIWRMSQALGFEAASDHQYDSEMAVTEVLNSPQDVVLIDDAAVTFRRWPSHNTWPHFLYNSTDTSVPEWLVIKMSSPITSGDLWHTLVSGEAQTLSKPDYRQELPLLSRTIAILSINDLRADRLHVSKSLSWERAAIELASELKSSPRLEALRMCRFVVVAFDMDGALLAEFPKAEGEEAAAPKFRLIFDPARLEGDSFRRIPGSIVGLLSCLAAAVTVWLPDSPAESTDVSSLDHAVRVGLRAMHRLMQVGHGPVKKETSPEFPKEVIAAAIRGVDVDELPRFGATSIPTDVGIEDWSIITNGSGLSSSPEPLWGLARRVACRGVQELTETPYLQVGKLFSVERTEIESFRGLHRLMKQYDADAGAEKPLSIAVFGPPGSGKSFGVKQLAKSVFSEDVPLLEFNLSQFEQPHQLIGLFHQVRDKVLEGKLPVVFWDEFDSRELMWLQYLLAPMQDGKFQEGQITHPIGKCIFVFAGGTRHRFRDFGEPPTEFGDDKITRWKTDFQAKKGPDFKSRLAGYLDVLGPNPSQYMADITFPVRRALLLRVNLKKFDSDRLLIDPGLLSAFLEIDEYRHGARSMEKIAEHIRLGSRMDEYWRSDLPPRIQLDMHVNAERFMALVGGNQ